MKAIRQCWLGGVLVLLVACSGLQVTPPQNASETVFYTYGLYTSVVNTAADLVENGTITFVDGQKIQDQLKPFRANLNAAESLAVAGLAVPQTQLQAVQEVQKILLAIQSQLAAKIQQEKGAKP